MTPTDRHCLLLELRGIHAGQLLFLASQGLGVAYVEAVGALAEVAAELVGSST